MNSYVVMVILLYLSSYSTFLLECQAQYASSDACVQHRECAHYQYCSGHEYACCSPAHDDPFNYLYCWCCEANCNIHNGNYCWNASYYVGSGKSNTTSDKDNRPMSRRKLPQQDPISKLSN